MQDKTQFLSLKINQSYYSLLHKACSSAWFTHDFITEFLFRELMVQHISPVVQSLFDLHQLPNLSLFAA
jgi:hypothetical protein